MIDVAFVVFVDFRKIHKYIISLFAITAPATEFFNLLYTTISGYFVVLKKRACVEKKGLPRILCADLFKEILRHIVSVLQKKQ